MERIYPLNKNKDLIVWRGSYLKAKKKRLIAPFLYLERNDYFLASFVLVNNSSTVMISRNVVPLPIPKLLPRYAT